MRFEVPFLALATCLFSAGCGPSGSDGDAQSGGAPSTGGQPGPGGTAGTGGPAGTDSGTGIGATGSGGTAGMDAAVPSPGCDKARTLQDGNHTLTSGGQSRTYHLRAPAAYDSSRPYRLIFMFHWYYGSIKAIVNPPDADHNTDEPYYGLGDLAGESTIFIVPQGLTDSGGAGWANPDDRDVTFTDDMLAAVTGDLCVDTSRVFTTGFSYGGAISYKLACVRADKFRAAIVYDTGPISRNDPSECTTPIAFFESHGLDDQTFKYQVGLSVLDIFVGANGCTPTTPPSPPQDGHTCTSFEGCSAGHPVRFCNFGSGQNNPHNESLRGHYPSPKDPGQPTSWVPAEVWSFIEQF